MKLRWLLTTYQSHAASAHWCPSLVSDKHVPPCRYQSVSPGTGALVWFSCSQEWKWMMQITVMSCCSNSCCQTSVKLLATFTFQCTTHVQEHWAATRDSGLHTRCMTSQHLSSVDYRLLRVIQECVYQKQQGTSNIVDELCLLTEWHFINRLTHHISQGRVVTPIKFTSVSVCQTLSQYNAVWQSYCKNRRVQFFLPHSVEWCGYLKVKKVWGHV